MAKLKVGIVGSGSWATRYGESFKEKNSELVELVAVGGGRRADRYAQNFGLRAEESAEALCAARDIDIVVVACPHGLHDKYAVLAAQNKKHVLVEKPMALSVAACDRMIQAARANGVKLMVAHSRRYFPLVRKAKEILDSGALGKIIFLRQTFCHDARSFGGDGVSWRGDPSLSMGFFIGYGCHQLDMTLWLVGSKVTTVSAQFGHYWEKEPIEKTGTMFMRFENGVYSSLLEFCSMPAGLKDWPPFPGMHEVNEIVCERGLMELRPYSKLMVRKSDGWETVQELPPREADPLRQFLRQEVEDLARSALSNTEPPIPGEAGRHTVQVCLAAYESSQKGREIALA
jgi:predicted dehydrogenase